MLDKLQRLFSTSAADKTKTAIRTSEERETHRRAVLEKIVALGKSVAEVSDLKTTLLRIWHGVHDDLEFDRTAIFLYDPEQGSINGSFGTDLNGDIVEEWGYSRSLKQTEPTSFTRVLERPDGLYFTRDFALENHIPAGHEMYGVKDYIAVAVWAGNKPVAILCGDNAITQRPVSEEQVEALRLFAGYAGLAIANAHLYQVERERRQEAETLRESLEIVASTLDKEVAVDHILEQLERVVPYNSASVQLLHAGYLEIVGGRGLPDPVDHVGMKFEVNAMEPSRPILDGKLPYVLYRDVRDHQSTFSNPPHERIVAWLAIPLRVAGEIIGIIALDGYRIGQFSERHAQLAVTYGDQVAIALENARLYQAEQEGRREADTLRKSLASVVTLFELNEIVERILDEIKLVIPYDTASVWRVDGSWLSLIIGRDLPPELPSDLKMPIDDNANAARQLLIQGEIPYILKNNVQEELTNFRGPHSYINSWLVVPLKKRGRIIGQIALDGKRKGQFTPHHADLEVIFADQVAIALENASLYSEIQQELAERKRAEESLRANEEKIRELNASLERRVEERTEQLQAEKARIERIAGEVATLRRLSDFLQACMTVDEACKIISSHMNSLFAGTNGALYLISDSFTDLASVALWGVHTVEGVIAPNDCWGMRRGRVFVRHAAEASPVCTHFGAEPFKESMCLPLLAQNETLGMLTMQISANVEKYFTPDVQNLAVASADSIALALANLRLRERLHNQSVRDSLTGLFNRRYLEETLARETHRASRSHTPLCVIMFEIDDFKLYNNNFGHDAGDYVLRKVADTMRANLRRSDFPCRYGGDEFTLLLPETTLEDGAHRAEELRKSVEILALSYGNQALGQVTVRMGVAAYPRHGDTGEGVLKVADDASYRARAIGKNCVVVAE